MLSLFETFVVKPLYMPWVQVDGRQMPCLMKTGVVETFRLIIA